MRKILTTSLLLLLVLFPIYANAGVSSLNIPGTERFSLYRGCKPIGLGVHFVPESFEKIGLTYQAIFNRAELKLRSARIYETILPPVPPSKGEKAKVDHIPRDWLYISTFGNKYGFTIVVELQSWSTLPDYGISGPAITWNRVAGGTHGQSADFILSMISKLLDEFIVEYLRVNEKDCK